MLNAEEIKRWLETLEPGSQVGIGEDGLTLHEIHGEQLTAAYLEVGGIPEEIEAG